MNHIKQKTHKITKNIRRKVYGEIVVSQVEATVKTPPTNQELATKINDMVDYINYLTREINTLKRN